MNLHHARHLCLVALLGIARGLVFGADAPPLTLDFSRSNPSLHIVSADPARTSILLETASVTMLDTITDFRTYALFDMAGEPPNPLDGYPVVPQITRLYCIPNTGGVALEFEEPPYELLENVDPFPFQLQEPGFGKSLQKEPSVYQNDEWYPPHLAVMSAPMVYRDFRVVQLTLYPVQVNPLRRQARVYSDLHAEIVATGGIGENEIAVPRRPSGAFAPLYRAQIANLDEHALDDVTTMPGGYLILCKNHATSLEWADSLATWKRRAGYTVTVDARASWSAVTMRQAVQQAYTSTETPLEFVCIMGDPQSTSFAMPTNTTGNEGTYDHYFASLTTGDEIEDVGLGRLPISTSSDFATIIAKIMAYERTPHMADPSWFGRAFLYAGTGNGVSSNEITMLWARQQFYHFTGVGTVNVATHPNNVSNTLIATRLNEGVSYFLWRGTVVGEMSNSAAYGTNNGPRLPVVLAITCGTGDFNNETSISESWILAGTPNALKGGVCGIGTATWGTHVHFNNTVAGGLIYAICNLGVEHLGPALAGAKAQLYAAFPSDGSGALHFTRWNNLMGDPGLLLWTQQPTVINATCPGTVNVGARRVQVQVTDSLSGQPIEDALVVLWKPGETYTRFLTNQFGFADVPVTVNTAGTMTLTVTKRNHKPRLLDISCVPAVQMVTLNSCALDDDNVGGTSGNSNSRLNPGETIDLTVRLRNFGTTQTAPAGSVLLTSSNPRLQVTQNSSSFGDVAPGDSVLCDTPFRVTAAPTMENREDALLTFTVTAGGELTHSALTLTCEAGEPIYSSHRVTGGDNDTYLEPGETAGLRVSVRNVGKLSLSDVTATLRSNSSFVAIVDGAASYGTIQVDSTRTNTGDEFMLTANSIAFPGHRAELVLELVTPQGQADTITFTIPLGVPVSTDPTGPDAFGYYAYDNTDAAYEMSRPFHYLSISDIGTNLDLSDPGEQPPSSPTYSTVRNLPFPFRFYGKTYTQITVCSNGWAAFGDQHEQDQFRNYPIPGQQAPDAMIAPFWDDLKTSGSGLGVWDYFDADSHRYVIQWKARGAFQTSAQDFEIVLLDPTYHITRDSSGIVLVQYLQVGEMIGQTNDVPYSTVGIQAPGGTVGLQYRFNNIAAPGAASLVAGRSIVYSTESRAAFGAILGTITDAESGLPLPGVCVSLDGQVYRDTSDSNGQYMLDDVWIGTYTLRATYPGFNDGIAENTVIALDETTAVDFAMVHPEIQLSVDHVSVSLPQQSAETFFQIINEGNGPLEYQIEVAYAPAGGLDEPWRYLAGVDVSAITGDQLVQGCEMVGDYWWVSGAGGPDCSKLFYRFDREGHYVNAIRQPSDSSIGWFDMAFDGQYVYGSNGPGIVGVNSNGVVRDTIPSPLNPTRALAYDPQSGHFWVADYSADIFEITRDGTIIRRFPSQFPVTGLSWNPLDANGYRLYVFGRDAAGQHARVSRMHPVSGRQESVIELERLPGDRSGGCAITGAWDNTLLVFAAVLQGAAGDRLGIWELDFNTTWLTIAPKFGSVGPSSARDITLTFDPTGLRDATYRANLFIVNNSAVDTLILPVSLTLTLPVESPVVTPIEYALHQNYPNPFNAATTFRYDLERPGWTTLRIYNLLGEEVTTVVDGFQEAGIHTVSFELSGLASGVYLYHLESGSFRDTRKLVLIR